MMLSMIFVMVTMSAASGRRIAEVLNDQADLVNPENPDPVIPDGRIDFDHVNFSYKHGSGKETLTDIDPVSYTHLKRERGSLTQSIITTAEKAFIIEKNKTHGR